MVGDGEVGKGWKGMARMEGDGRGWMGMAGDGGDQPHNDPTPRVRYSPKKRPNPPGGGAPAPLWTGWG